MRSVLILHRGNACARSTALHGAGIPCALRFAVIVLALCFCSAGAQAQRTPSAPAALNRNARVDSGPDNVPQIVTDRDGHWVAVWQSRDTLGDTIGTDSDILVARSNNNGLRWSWPKALNTNAATDFGDDGEVEIAVGLGGHWMAVWSSTDDLSGTIGNDYDILVAHSTDNGRTWTAPAALNTNAAIDSGMDNNPQIVTDGRGRWVVAWFSTDSLGGSIGNDEDILFARSDDNGATWTAPAALNTNAASDGFAVDARPSLATNGHGVWLAAWWSTGTLGGTLGGEGDILVSRSTDNGSTWAPPSPANTNAATDAGSDFEPAVAVDDTRNWIVAFSSNDTLGGTIGTDFDILVARSTDDGATWAPPAPLNANAATDTGGDRSVEVVAQGGGRWLALWSSTDSLGGTIGTDLDILIAYSSDGGQNWKPAMLVNTNAATQNDLDDYPSYAFDGAGHAIAIWTSSDTLGGTIGSDLDILQARWTPYRPADVMRDVRRDPRDLPTR